MLTKILICLFICTPFLSFGFEGELQSKNLSELEGLFHSQASQDKFVYLMLYRLLGKTDQGYYLEIGAADPKEINNSYFFENYHDWKGVSIDISAAFYERWVSCRKNPLLIEDATSCDYHKILKPFPRVIDYLSLDIDDLYDVVLNKIPFDAYIFKIITIEHDGYRYGDKFKNSERKILSSLGYYLLCEDVSSFEDWWIYPNAFPSSILASLKKLDLKGKSDREIIALLENFSELLKQGE